MSLCEFETKGPSRLLLADGHLLLRRDDLAKHHDAVAVEERNARQALAVLERVHDERLLRLEHALRHLVRLHRVRLLHLLPAGLLADLPEDLRHTARRAAAAHEADRRVADLDLARDVEDLDLSVEALRRAERRVLLVHHHVARARHVLLVETLDVHADVVARATLLVALVVHLDGEDLAGAGRRRSVRRQEHHLLARLHEALLDTPGNHIADTLDLVDARHRQAHRRLRRADRRARHLVQHVVERVDVELLRALLLVSHLDVHALPPRHVRRLLRQVVTAPPRDREDRRALRHEVLLPADLLEHVRHLLADLVVARLLVARGVAVHLVHADDELLHAEQVDQPRVLARLALDLARLVVATLDRRDEVAVRRDHDERHVRLRRARNHVLDEIAVARRVNDRVVPLRGEELLRRARDGHATLTLLLLAVHEEGERERRLAETLGLLLELLQLTLRKTAQVEQQTAGRRRLARVDVTADHDRKVLTLAAHCRGFKKLLELE